MLNPGKLYKVGTLLPHLFLEYMDICMFLETIDEDSGGASHLFLTKNGNPIEIVFEYKSHYDKNIGLYWERLQ